MNNTLSTEDYAVYQALLRQKINLGGRAVLVIQQELGASPPALDPGETLESVVLRMLQAFKEFEAAIADDPVLTNQEPVHLEPKLDLPLPYVLLTESESDAIWNRPDRQSMPEKPMDGWQIFHERYPHSGGVVNLSAVSFSKDKTQALVQMGVQAGWLLGHGDIVLMTRNESGWKVTEARRLWVS